MPAAKEFNCRGINYLATLRNDGMTIAGIGFGKSRLHELPMKRIESVIVHRKSIVPFATLTVLALIAAVIVKFNGLWFLYGLDPWQSLVLSVAASLAAALFAIPTIFRLLFVDVIIAWDGRPKSFLIRFVPAGRGKRLATRFQRISAGS